MSKRLSEAADSKIQSPGTISVQSPDGLSAELDVAKSGPVGVILRRLRVTGPPDDLTRRAADVARTIHPSGATLTPIEVDPRLGGATLRSPVDRQRRFYEAEVTEDSVELTRCTVGEDGARAPAEFSLTREGLSEILDGIEDVMLPEEDG